MERNRLILLGILLAVFLIGGISLIQHRKTIATDKANEQQIAKQIAAIERSAEKMRQEKDSARKLAALQKIEEEQATYQKKYEPNKKVLKAYDEGIASGQQFFITQNDQMLKQNTTADLQQESLATLKTKIKNLTDLSKGIATQEKIVYEAQAAAKVQQKIQTQQKSYQTQLTTLEKQAAIKKAEVTENSQAAANMDLGKIQQGDYGSLLGEWQEVAISLNRHDQQGDKWQAGRDETLSVSENQLSDGSMTLAGKTLNDGEAKPIVFSEKAGYLVADSQNQGGAIWSIYFYPKNVPMTNWGETLPTAIDSTKDRIVIRTSNNSFVEVFQRNGDATAIKETTSQTTIDPSQTNMDLAAIKTGDYTSLNGTWKNSVGETILVKNERMEFSDITLQQQAAVITGQTLAIPELDASDGKPKIVPYLGNTEMEAYQQQLVSEDAQDFFSLKSSIPSALIYVSFLPSGVKGGILGEMSAAELNQGKIIAIGTQNSATSVDEQYVYYRIK